jgi:hypothetical protein
MMSVPVLAVATAVALVVGAASVLAALWLILRAGRVAVGLPVLALGAALVALPWLAAQPEPPAPAPAEPEEPEPAPVALSVSKDGLRTVAAPPSAAPPPLPGRPAARLEIEASEAEPNDTIAGSNVARLGTAITGSLAEGDLDYFAVEIPPGTRAELVVGLAVFAGDAGITIFDDAGAPLGGADTSEQISVRTTRLVRLIDRPRYHVLVRPAAPGGTATYQLTIAARPR